MVERLPVARLGSSRPSRCCGAASPPPRPTCTPRRPRSCAPRRTSRRWSRRRGCPTASGAGRWPCSRALAEAEGRLHRRPPEQVHFHEVGGLDAIVDVVGTCAALEVLDIDIVYGSVVVTGTGMVRAAHGLLPNPAPAVVELLAGVGAPTRGIDLGVELTTPTGAALLAALASGFGPMPPMTIECSGFGAGTRDLDGQPNATQVVIGDAERRGARRPAGRGARGERRRRHRRDARPHRRPRCSTPAPTTPGSRRSS